MKSQIAFAFALLMFGAVSTCLAQESIPSDSGVAIDEVTGTIVEHVTGGFPTDATSWMIQAAQAAAPNIISDAVAVPLGGFFAGMSSSYTAGPDLDMVGGTDPNAFLNSYNQQVQMQHNQQIQLDQINRQMLNYQRTIPPAGPSLSPCYGCRSTR